MNKTISGLVVAATLWPAAAFACDDHVGKCKIEAWRAVPQFGHLQIEGSATCDRGSISIRLYDATGGKDRYLGNAVGMIRGHAITAIATNMKMPGKLAIKYSIRPR